MIGAVAGLLLGLLVGALAMGWRARRQMHRASDEVGEKMLGLARERERFEDVLQAMDDAVLAVDAAGRVTLLNDSAVQLLGLTTNQDIEGELLSELGTTTALNDLVQSMADRHSASAELLIDGPPTRAYLARATRKDRTGGVVLVVQDVTRLRKLEKMRKDFVANVSHELRTPVTIIRANAETLMDGAINEPKMAENFLGALLRNADRLSTLVSDLLDLSRIESGRLELSFDALNVRKIAAIAIDAVDPKTATKNQEVHLDIAEELTVIADANALEQVLVNLLSNASNYSPEEGAITVRAHSEGHLCRIEVVDNGPGIDPKHHRRVFERFYRVDKGRSRGVGGTGLGLAIVKHLVTTMGGTVGLQTANPSADTRPGCCFWFTLPMAQPD